MKTLEWRDTTSLYNVKKGYVKEMTLYNEGGMWLAKVWVKHQDFQTFHWYFALRGKDEDPAESGQLLGHPIDTEEAGKFAAELQVSETRK